MFVLRLPSTQFFCQACDCRQPSAFMAVRARHMKTPLKSHNETKLRTSIISRRFVRCRFPNHWRRNNYRRPNHVCRLKRETSTSSFMLLSKQFPLISLHEYSQKMLQSEAIVNKPHWRFRYIELYAAHQPAVDLCLIPRIWSTEPGLSTSDADGLHVKYIKSPYWPLKWNTFPEPGHPQYLHNNKRESLPGHNLIIRYPFKQ